MKFSFVIGRYWDEGPLSVCSYSVGGGEIHWGTEEEAFALAKQVSKIEGREYRVFRLLDMGAVYDPDPC